MPTNHFYDNLPHPAIFMHVSYHQNKKTRATIHFIKNNTYRLVKAQFVALSDYFTH